MPTSQPSPRPFPEFATSEDLPGADHGALTDNTESRLARWQAYEEEALAELRAIPPQSLRDESDRVLHSVLLDEIELSTRRNRCFAADGVATRAGRTTVYRQRSDPFAAGSAPRVFVAQFSEQATLSPEEVRGEVNRYISWPGQAPSYMIGNLEILRLREAAGTKLGEHFDIRAFHDQVLGRGSVTLPLLRTLLEEWIEAAGSTPSLPSGVARP